MSFRRGSFLTLIAVPVVAIGLAACGGSSNDSSSSNAASSTPAQTGGSDTVSTMSVSGVGTVLVDSTGAVLYTNDQDSGSKIACTGQCLTEWTPLSAPSGGQPTSSDSAVQAKLGVTNGQVTFGGMPLYSFVEDQAGQATGDGFKDSFGGTDFTWTAAATGGAPASSGSTSSGSSGGGSSGGYSAGY
jgi:predicted lipoprotein with Yx(FWY)xxD motif